VKILKDEELQSKWDKNATTFPRYLEPSTNQTAQTLLASIDVSGSTARSKTDPVNLLEIGCGGGGASLIATILSDPAYNLTSIDLSPSMLQVAQARHQKQFPDSRTKFMQGSAESLQFDDESIDKIFSNYVMHLVRDPNKAFREAHRVLKAGGLFAFSIWGRKENSPRKVMLGPLLERLKKENGVESSQVERSPFHLCDRDTVRKMISDAGFSSNIAWYQSEVVTPIDIDGIIQSFLHGNPMSQELYGRLNDDAKQAFIKDLRNDIESRMKDGYPLIDEVLIVVATK